MDLGQALMELKSLDSRNVLNALKVISRTAFRNPESVELHIETIRSKLHDADESICAYAAWAAGQIGRDKPSWYENEISHLVFLINHRNEKIKENALFALGWIGRAEPCLIEHHIYSIVEKYRKQSNN